MNCVICDCELPAKRKKLCGSKECTKRSNALRVNFNLKGDEEKSVNNILSQRWEMLHRLLNSFPNIQELMYEIERRFPLSLRIKK